MECKIWRYNNTIGVFEIVAILPFISIVKEVGFYEVGKLQLVIPPYTYNNMPVYPFPSLSLGERFLTIGDDPTLMYMQTIERRKDSIYVYGMEAKGVLNDLWADNIVSMPTQASTPAAAVIVSLVNAYNSGGYEILGGATQIPWLYEAYIDGADENADLRAVKGNTVLNIVQECCKIGNRGFDIILNSNQKAVMRVFGESTEVKTFSDFLGNLKDAKVKQGIAGYYNKVYVKGANDIFVASTVPIYEGDIDGGIRSKMMDLSSYNRPSSMSVADYRQSLIDSANIEVYKCQQPYWTVTGEILTDANQSVRTGDKVKLVASGSSGTVGKITRIQYTYEGNKTTIKCTVA